MKTLIRVAAVTVLAAGCSREATQRAQRPAGNAANEVQSQAVTPVPPPGTGPDARTPFAQPTAKEPTLDPKSTEAAKQLMRDFVRLLNSSKFDEAYMLLGPTAPPRSEFDRNFSNYSNLRVTLGEPGDQEGAAGSIYLSIPLTVSGAAEGKHVSRSASAILRRVNDVPGSTEAQRHWHIERIDWGNGT